MDRIKNIAYVGASSIISSLGIGTKKNIEGLEEYKTNISERYSTPVCGIDREDIEEEAGYSFAENISIKAINEVLAKSGVDLSKENTQLVVSTTKGNIEYINEDIERAYLWNMAAKIEKRFNCAHKSVIVSNACVSGVAGIALAARMIEREETEHVIVLGVDVLSEFVVSGFNSFKSVSSTICQPYSKDRNGLTLGEGCGVILITSDKRLSDEGISIAGSGISNDANHISGPSRTGDGLFYAIDKAMKQAGLKAEDIDMVNAHGTGTVYNDEMESKAIELAGLRNVACNSLKPYIGHTLGASGVIETIMLVEQMKQNKVYGVKTYEECGTPYELNVDRKHRDIEINNAIKTASGFGGTNAAIVLMKHEQKRTKSEKVKEAIEIAEVEIKAKYTGDVAQEIKDEFTKYCKADMKFFKMDKLSRLGYVATSKLLQGRDLSHIDPSRIGFIMANRSSSMDTDLRHQANVDKHLAEGSSPAVFVYTLANIVAGEVCIKHKFKGELMCFVQEERDIEFVRAYSHKVIEEDICDAVVYGWCELMNDDYNVELKLITSVR